MEDEGAVFVISKAKEAAKVAFLQQSSQEEPRTL